MTEGKLRKYPGRRSISMRTETHDRLLKERKVNEGFDDFINRLLDERERGLAYLGLTNRGSIQQND